MYQIIATLIMIVLLTGCGVIIDDDSIAGSGNIITQEESFTDFDRVEISGGFEAELRQAETYSVVLRIDESLVPYLDLEQQGRTLMIRMDQATNYRNVERGVTITLPDLVALSLSGGSTGTITGFETGGDVTVVASGGAGLRGDLVAGTLDAAASGGSTLSLQGRADDVTVESSGGSIVDLAEFAVDDATVNASGGGEVTVNAGGQLDATASGGSRVFYLGEPTLGQTNVSGGGSLKPR